MTKTIRNIMMTVIAVVVMAMMLIGGIGVYKLMWWHEAPKYNEVRIGAGSYVEETDFVTNEKMVLVHHLNGDDPIMTLGEYVYYDDGAVEAKTL